MTIAPPSAHLQDSLRIACEVRGLNGAGAKLIHHYNNAVYLLPAEGAVARVTIGSAGHEAALRAHAVARWLTTERGFPATSPLDDVMPVEVDATSVVSFWMYYPQGDRSLPTSRDLGPILRQLHNAGNAPVPLPEWVPLASLQRALDNMDDHAVLTSDEWSWLRGEVAAVRENVASLRWPLPRGLIHGDAWAGNLLWAASEFTSPAVLGDWDGLAIGPREVDLIPTWHAARRYAKGKAWIREFVDGYGYDLAVWPGYGTLYRMRDLMQITGPLRRARPGNVFAAALRQRLTGCMRHDETHWVAL
jgi:hypothetical protein